jgi:hypothetical protein
MKPIIISLFILLSSCNSNENNQSYWWVDSQEFELRNSKNEIIYEKLLGQGYNNYYFSKKNKLIEKQVFNIDSILTEKHLFNYDDNENMIIEIILFSGEKANELPNTINYSYDNKNRIIKKSEFNGFGQICNNTIYDYPDEKTVVENCNARFGGLGSKTIKTYNKNSLLEKEMIILENDIEVSNQYKYDLNGNLIQVNDEIVKYLFNNNGKWIKKYSQGQTTIRQYITER